MSFVKEGETFCPTLEQLIAIYSQAAQWGLKYEYSHYHEYYAGSGDDYSYSGTVVYTIFSPEHKYIKKIVVDSGDNFTAIEISARVYFGSLTPTLYIDGRVKGANEYDESCPRMDGPEDWGYRDKYTLVKNK